MAAIPQIWRLRTACGVRPKYRYNQLVFFEKVKAVKFLFAKYIDCPSEFGPLAISDEASRIKYTRRTQKTSHLLLPPELATLKGFAQVN